MAGNFLNTESLPSTIKEFFKSEDFQKMSEYEKIHLRNVRQNYEVLKQAGLNVKPPEFMLRKKGMLMRKSAIESSEPESSDSEWTPALERPKRQSAKKFFPTFTKIKSQKSIRSSPRLKKTTSNVSDVEKHEYSLRKSRTSCYMSLAIPDDDEYLFCEECNFEYMGDCPEHGGLNIVEDSKVPSGCIHDKDNTYAIYTVPEGLAIGKSKIPGAGMGVFATKFFPQRTRFGPYLGKIEKNEMGAHESGYSWQVCKDGKVSHYVDAKDPSKSNWMRFVNCARCEDEQCVTAYQHQGQIYYRTHRDIFPGTEILVYYGDSYAKDLGIQVPTVGQPNKQHVAEEDASNKRHVKEQVVANNRHGVGVTVVRQAGQQMVQGLVHCSFCPVTFSSFNFYINSHLKHKHSSEYWKYRRSHEQQLHHEITGVNKDMKQHKKLEESRNVKTKCRKYQYNDKSDKLLSEEQINTSKRKVCGHQSEKVFVCHACNKPFHNQKNLTTHQFLCPGETLYTCHTCGRSFLCQSNLNRHEFIHSGKKRYTCEMCGKKFTQRSTLVTHSLTHTGEKPYICDMCGQTFSRLSNLNRHKLVHSKEKHHTCDMCGKKFTQRSTLVTHRRIHTGEKPYRCDTCGKAYTSQRSLTKHKCIHSGEKSYSCAMGGKSFMQSSNVTTHSCMNTGQQNFFLEESNNVKIKGRKYQYNDKSDKILSEEQINASKRKVSYSGHHQRKISYICDACNKPFHNKKDFDKHLFLCSGEKLYMCHICNKSFSRQSNLTRHGFVHTGEKRYTCDMCGKKFTEKSTLIIHCRIHTGIKPYSCDICSKAFSSQAYLTSHKRIHSGEKPYSCAMCGKSFTHSPTSNVTRHRCINTGQKSNNV